MKKQRRIVVLGYTMVGKTAISSRLCSDRFRDEYEPTYENSYRRTMRYKGQEVDVTIVDTQGQDEQEIFRNEYCLGAHGYILVFSIASPRSLRNLEVINDKLVNLMGTDRVARVLVGNKSDLESDRRVPVEEARRIAEQWNSPYIECSAKQNSNIDDVFRLALQQVDYFSDGDSLDSSSSSWISACSRILQFFLCCSLWNTASSTFQTDVPSQFPTQLRHRLSLSFLLWSNLVCGLTTFAISLSIVAKAHASDAQDLLAYMLFGIGLLQSLISSIGLLGLRFDSKDYIRWVSFYSYV